MCRPAWQVAFFAITCSVIFCKLSQLQRFVLRVAESVHLVSAGVGDRRGCPQPQAAQAPAGPCRDVAAGAQTSACNSACTGLLQRSTAYPVTAAPAAQSQFFLFFWAAQGAAAGCSPQLAALAQREMWPASSLYCDLLLVRCIYTFKGACLWCLKKQTT